MNINDRPPQYGVFFDGTGNNLTNDIASWEDDKTPANVATLFLLYFDKTEYSVGKTYIAGVGTEEGAGDSDSDIDMGIAYTFRDRIRQTLGNAKKFFEDEKFSNAPVGILDVFGFSRGAAAARHFVNEVHRLNKTGPTYFGGPQLQVRFLGIFDTVGSIGKAGDNSQRDIEGETFNLELHPQAAQYVYHLTARHTQREYFPLNSILSGPGQAPVKHFVEVEMFGVHSDVGGGYGPGQDVVYYPTKRVGWSNHMMRDAKLRELKLQYEREYRELGIDILYENQPIQGRYTLAMEQDDNSQVLLFFRKLHLNLFS